MIIWVYDSIYETVKCYAFRRPPQTIQDCMRSRGQGNDRSSPSERFDVCGVNRAETSKEEKIIRRDGTGSGWSRNRFLTLHCIGVQSTA
jgi:hypothetical protein